MGSAAHAAPATARAAAVVSPDAPAAADDWPHPLRRPPRLKPGDRVAVVTASWGGPAEFPLRYAVGKGQLAESFGLEVVEMRHARRDAAWIARNPAARADDLMRAFADARIAGIVAAIGGDDAVRLIPHVDLAVIAANPKVLLGYSDSTVLHFGCLKAGLGSFYGPSIMSGFAENGGLFPYMVESLRRVVFTAAPAGEVAWNRDGWTSQTVDWANPLRERRRLHPARPPRLLQGRGRVRGPLLGGCAETLERLKKTAWWPPLERWRGAILFYETSEEAPPPSAVAAWLGDFARRGILAVVSGMLVGRPGGEIDPARHAEYEAAIVQALAAADLPSLPVLAGLDFGHTDPICTIPYGVRAEIDCGMPSWRILEPAVA